MVGYVTVPTSTRRSTKGRVSGERRDSQYLWIKLPPDHAGFLILLVWALDPIPLLEAGADPDEGHQVGGETDGLCKCQVLIDGVNDGSPAQEAALGVQNVVREESNGEAMLLVGKSD